MHIVISALNRWMHEQWTFDYEHRIFASPVITLPFVDQAIHELEWVVERGAKVILIRPAAVPGVEGVRSFALPEFDPFWEKVVEADVAVGMHASDDGSPAYLNVWAGNTTGAFRPFHERTAFEETFRRQHRGISDAMMSAVCHGLFSRFPTLRVLPIEHGSHWIAPLLELVGESYATHPYLCDEDPVA